MRYSDWISSGARPRGRYQADLPPAREVVADLPDGPNRVLQGQVPQNRPRILEHAQQDARGAHLEVGGVLVHVRIAHNDV